MRRNEAWAVLWLSLAAASLSAQVVSPPEIRDPALRKLQQEHFAQLKSVAVAVTAHQFPYRFYFSRTLDLDEKQQAAHDQRSIQFARYGHQTVVQITGNYYASYSDERVKRAERAERTFTDVMLPILEAEVPRLYDDPEIQGFALEISHHVRKRMLGVTTERPENMVLVIPKDAAMRLIKARDQAAQVAALDEGSLFINGQPAVLWADLNADTGQTPTPQAEAAAPAAVAPVPPPAPPRTLQPAPAPQAPPASPSDLQTRYQDTLNKMVQALDSTAHFVSYAPPCFVEFHKGVYLQLSLTTTLPAAGPASQYRVAALGFDTHIAHLVRPVLAQFKNDMKFTGIDFSTTVKPAGVAVEYIFNLPDLRCYERYDCTGQQLINSGFVLINGERVSLDLQDAER
jgi:hypothetical protein